MRTLDLGGWVVRLGAGLLLALALPGVAAADASFGEPETSSEFGAGIEFRQPVETDRTITRAELLLEIPGASGALVVESQPPSGRDVTLVHELDIAEGHILPNTTLTGRWRVTEDDGSQTIGPPSTVTYEDDRFDWQTREGDVVRVHWYEGDAGFGARALQIGERAVTETAELLGVTEDEPVDFFVYASQDVFYDALGPGTRENVGGQANAEIRTLFALITPADINQRWVEIVIPHELVHLVFDTAVENPYHFPPRWLNEGLAVYLSQGYAVDDRLQVEGAASDGSLIPLDGITGQFPTTFDRFGLAYAESVSAVDFLIRAHGQEALVTLIRSYADGVTDDEAFESALGMDVAAFDAAWRDDLGAVEPQVHGPQPAPPGPLPPGWLGEDGSPPPTIRPGAATHAPAATPVPGSPGSGGSGGSGQPGSPLLVGLIGTLVVGGIGLALWLRSRRRRAPGQQPPPWQEPAP